MGGWFFYTTYFYLTNATFLSSPLMDGILYSVPKKGSALLFFPAAGGIPNAPFDIRTIHCSEVIDAAASTDKWISQLWLRQYSYKPTAPPGNIHAAAQGAIADYCKPKKHN